MILTDEIGSQHGARSHGLAQRAAARCGAQPAGALDLSALALVGQPGGRRQALAGKVLRRAEDGVRSLRALRSSRAPARTGAGV